MANDRIQGSAGMHDLLKAAHIYGYKAPEVKIGHPEPPAEYDRVLAVYPMINEEAYSMMMDRYRRFIDAYNKAAKLENADIDIYNKAVRANLDSKPVPDAYRHAAANFYKRNSRLFSREYNEQVDITAQTIGQIILKRKIQLVKYATEQFFANFLHVYNTQLKSRNKEYMRLSVATETPVMPLKVNSFFITQLQRAGGVASIDVCGRTVRNHRQRLEEAGVFVNSAFRGWQRAVEVEINPEIFVVYDIKTEKIATIENQSLMARTRKQLPDNNEITGAIIKEYQEKNDAAQSFVDKVSAKPTAFGVTRAVFTETTQSKDGISPVGGAAESVKVPKTLTEQLRDLIIHPQELAENLTAGMYNNYSPIDVRALYREAYAGRLTSEEFRELVIQDFFKTSAKIWREATPYAGSWKKAINLWMKHKFRSFNGTALHKTAIVDQVTQLRWRLDQARRWFMRSGVKALYPSDYFDITRTTSKEIGFEYTIKAWQRHLKYMETLPKEEVLVKKRAERRKKRNADATKYEAQVRRFLRNRITLPQLYEFVSNNLPGEFLQELPKTLQKKMAESVK